MFLSFDTIYKELLAIPAFKALDLHILSKIFPYLYQKEYSTGSHIYYVGDQADNLYILIDGKIRLDSHNKVITYFNKDINKNNWIIGKPVYDEFDKGLFGEEVILDNSSYSSNAYVSKDAKVIVLPKEIFKRWLLEEKAFINLLMASLMKHYNLDKEISHYEDDHEENPQHHIKQKEKKVKSKPIDEKQSGKLDIPHLISWFLLIIVPLVIYNFSSYMNLDWRSKNFFIILSITVLMWILRLVPDFVANIFAMMAIVILDIVPAHVAFSGFTSGSFHMAMSVFGMAIIFLNSGLSYRVVLYILKILPNSQVFYSFFIFLFCFLIVPIFPSANGRIILMSPLMLDILQSLGYKKKLGASNLIATMVFNALTLLSAVFLSSKLIHFVIYGLLSRQTAEFFGWGNWFLASLAYLVVVGAIFFILLLLIFGNKEQSSLSKSQVGYQLKILGSITHNELGALFSIVFFIVGILTSSLHKISISWIGLIVLFVLLTLNFLSKKNFQMKIDWSFLIYLATLLGIVKVMNFLDFNKYIILLFDIFPFNYITFFLEHYFILYILSMAVFVSLLRLFIPSNAVAVLLVSIFIPIAEKYGINDWIIAFIIIVLSDSWIFSYQCTYYSVFLDSTESFGFYDKKIVTFFSGFLMSVIKIIGLVVSTYYWRYIGIL